MIKLLLVFVGLVMVVGIGYVALEDTTPAAEQAIDSVTNNPPPAPATEREGVTLDLSGQDLTQVPSYIFDRPATETLDLSDNDLTGSLPAEVRHLQNLRVLNLANNNFTGVPAEIGQLGNLEVLDLSINNLTGLPYELGDLSNLKTLNLSGNQYAAQDLAIISAQLPQAVVIIVD